MVTVLNEQPSFGQRFGQGLGLGLSQGIANTGEVLSKLVGKKIERQTLRDALVAKGVDPKDAELYSYFTEGGKTQFAKDILEGRKRGLSSLSPRQALLDERTQRSVNPEAVKQALLGRGIDEGMAEAAAKDLQQRPLGLIDAEKMQKQMAEDEIEDYLQSRDEGTTPSERIRLGSERYRTGLPLFQEASKQLKGVSDSKARLGILQNLNKSKKLPKALGRINVDEQGNLRLPFLSSAEAQRFVKTVNEFAAGAKNTYGSRVTNFDLEQYLKQFPTLLNSEDGIKQLIEQLNIVNDINAVYYKNLKNVYDKAGGARYIDADIAQGIADRMSEPQVEKLVQKFSSIGTFEKLPPANKNKGQQFLDEDTGDVYVSDGKSWINRGPQ